MKNVWLILIYFSDFLFLRLSSILKITKAKETAVQPEVPDFYKQVHLHPYSDAQMLRP